MDTAHLLYCDLGHPYVAVYEETFHLNMSLSQSPSPVHSCDLFLNRSFNWNEKRECGEIVELIFFLCSSRSGEL